MRAPCREYTEGCEEERSVPCTSHSRLESSRDRDSSAELTSLRQRKHDNPSNQSQPSLARAKRCDLVGVVNLHHEGDEGEDGEMADETPLGGPSEVFVPKVADEEVVRCVAEDAGVCCGGEGGEDDLWSAPL